MRVLLEGRLSVWYGEGSPPAATLEAIAAHDAVIRAALRSSTPVPVRYGAEFSDEGAMRASLHEREEALLEALERVRDRVEMGLRVSWDRAPRLEISEVAVRSGTEYLEARRRELERVAEEESAASALLDEVDRRVAPEGTPTHRKLLPDPGVAGLLAHLVHRSEVRTYRSRVEGAREELPGVGLYLTGPWAPYSFV